MFILFIYLFFIKGGEQNNGRKEKENSKESSEENS